MIGWQITNNQPYYELKHYGTEKRDMHAFSLMMNKMGH